MKDKNKLNTEKAISEIENIFLFDLLPETPEEAREILENAGIDTTELKKEGRKIFRNMLVEFNDDWRNVPNEALEREASGIFMRRVQANLSRETLLERIKELTEALTAKGLSTPLPAGVLHRNLEKETAQDLASLLRQIQYIAEEAGIELREE